MRNMSYNSRASIENLLWLGLDKIHNVKLEKQVEIHESNV